MFHIKPVWNTNIEIRGKRKIFLRVVNYVLKNKRKTIKENDKLCTLEYDGFTLKLENIKSYGYNKCKFQFMCVHQVYAHISVIDSVSD